MDYLKIGLANAYGQDKLTFEQREAWVDRQENLDPMEAEEPAYAQALLSGDPDVLVWQDATSSGLQCLAALSNCTVSAGKVNLTGQDRQDVYTAFHKALGLPQSVTRKMSKDALVAASFGSIAVPRTNLGEENLTAFFHTFQKELPGVWNCLRWLEDLWQPNVLSHRWIMPDGFEVIVWNEGYEETQVMFQGAMRTIRRKCRTTKKRDIKLLAHVAHSTDSLICREMIKRAAYSPTHAQFLLEGPTGLTLPKTGGQAGALALWRSTGFLSVTTLGLLDQSMDLSEAERLEVVCLLEHLADKPQAFRVLPVHDSLGTRAKDCDYTRKMYQYLMQQLWDSDLLMHIAEEITGKREKMTHYPLHLDGVHMIC